MSQSRVPVLLSRTAASDLKSALDALALDSRSYAVKLNKRFAFRFEMLGRNPKLGAVCSELDGDFRRTTVDLYVIYYRVAESQVEIVRILHGSRDHGPLLDNQ